MGRLYEVISSSKLVYRLNAIPVTSQLDVLEEDDEIIPKCIWKKEDPRITKTLEKNKFKENLSDGSAIISVALAHSGQITQRNQTGQKEAYVYMEMWYITEELYRSLFHAI